MERAFRTATPRNRHARRVFKLVGAALILFVLIGISVVSSYKKTGHVTPADIDAGIMMQRLKAGDGSSAFPDFDSDKCDDGLPEGNFTTEEKCYFYSKLCPDDRMINYLEFRYCTLGDNLAAVIFGMALIVVWLLTLFYMLSQAAESHFCPMLSEISSALRMSPDLAGMSILAFGNGAPDVFSSIAAFHQNDVGVLVGEMLGAGAFITHIIVGAIGVTAHVRLRTYPFLRDLMCYLVGLAFVLVLLIDSKLHLWEASLFLVFYFLYLGVAIVIHVVEVKRGKASVVEKGKQRKEKDDLTASLLKNEVVVEAGEATLAVPDYPTPEGPGRRRRAMSVHITVVPIDGTHAAVSPAPAITTTTTTTTSSAEEEAATTTTTTSTTSEVRGRTLEVGPRTERGRSASPGITLSDAEAAHLRRAFQEIKMEDDEDARSAEEEVPELTLPSSDFSVQGNDQVRVSSQKTIPKETKEKKSHKVRELKGLSELKSVASSAAKVFLPKPGVELRRRYDNMDALRERQHHLFRNGILNVVQDWKEGGDLTLPIKEPKLPPEGEEGDGDSAALMERKVSLLQRYKDYVQWDEMGVFGRIVYIIMLPVSILMHITVPHPEDEAYNKWLLALSTFLSPITIFWALDLLREPNIWIAVTASMAFSLVCGILIAVFAKKTGLPRWLQFVFIFWGFVSSMMWIYFTADEVVSLLHSLSEMLGLSPTIMGLTLLAWGNCIGDFVADITVSNQGYPEMGIAATYGGPLFNLLIGMGLGGTIESLDEGLVPIPLDDMMLIDFIYLLSALVVSLVVIPARRFLVDKYTGIVLICGYAIFLTLSFLVEGGVIHILNNGSSSSSLPSSVSAFF